MNVDTDNDGKADINLDTTGDGKADSNIDTDGDGKPDKNLIGGVIDEEPKPEPPAEKPAEEPKPEPPVKDFPLTSDFGETALGLSSLMAMLLGLVVLAKKKHD